MTKTYEADRVRLTIKDEQGVEHELRGAVEVSTSLPKVKAERAPERIEFTMQLAGAIDPAPLFAHAWNEYIESLKGLVVERIAARHAEPTYNDAAAILAEVLNEEIDAGFEFNDAQLEALSEVMDRYDRGDPDDVSKALALDKDRV